MSTTSRLAVPSISISPDISKEAPVKTPATANVDAISTAPSMSTTSRLAVPSTSMFPATVNPAAPTNFRSSADSSQSM